MDNHHPTLPCSSPPWTSWSLSTRGWWTRRGRKRRWARDSVGRGSMWGEGGGGYFNFSISDFSTLDIFSSILGGFRIRWGGGRGGGSGRYNRRGMIRKTLPGLWTYSEENVFQSEFSCPHNCPSPGNNFGLTQPPAHSEETGSGTKSWRWNLISVRLF